MYVEGGSALWQAFDRHPRYFDTVFINLIKASEASGTLTTILRRLVNYRESREMLRKRVRGAMIYPVLLLVACTVALFVITSVVVPVFAEFFERSDMETPQTTQLLIHTSALIRTWWWIPLVALLAVILVYQKWFLRNPVRQIAADYIKLKLPLLGSIIHKNAITEMCRTMGLLLRSGLSMMSTLDLTRDAIHNRAVAESLKGMRDSVENGGSLEEPMRASGVIPSVIVDMFVTGEESGRVDQITEQIADIYEEEVKIAVSSLGEALQPVFTLIIGVVVLILFISLFLPMITMIDRLGSAGTL
jgi:type II secretory pathway component PulF